MSERDLERAETLMQTASFDQAFAILKGVVASTDSVPMEIADAYQMMGGIVQAAPQFGENDECGLSFYKSALKHVPDHVWALCGIIATFGERHPDHQDIEATQNAIELISSHVSDIDADMQRTVREKHDLLQKIQR